MSAAEAVKIFFSQVVLNGRLPFEVKFPKYNFETEQAMKEALKISPKGMLEVKLTSRLKKTINYSKSEERPWVTQRSSEKNSNVGTFRRKISRPWVSW